MTARPALAALTVAGLLLAGRGLWIPAKAALAQRLLESAWVRVQRGEGAARPWPWADTRPVARLVVPRLGASAIVLAGATGRTLAFGPGHLAGSAEPGAAGNTVLAGHRDTHLAFVRQLRAGDELQLETLEGRWQRYAVVSTRVVHERDLSPVAATPWRRLTLLTCYPFDTPVPGGPLRYAVVAEPAGAVP